MGRKKTLQIANLTVVIVIHSVFVHFLNQRTSKLVEIYCSYYNFHNFNLRGKMNISLSKQTVDGQIIPVQKNVLIRCWFDMEQIVATHI